MSIKITTKQAEAVTVLNVAGRITIGDETARLRETIRGSVNDGKKNILLDLGEVGYIDSTGLGELVSSHVHVINNGGQLKLLKLTNKVHDLLQITKLITVFQVFDDEADALKSFVIWSSSWAPMPTS